MIDFEECDHKIEVSVDGTVQSTNKAEDKREMSNKDVAMIEYPITINPHRQGNKDRVFHIEHPR